MLEYLNFFLLCAIFALILYLYIRTKKYFSILKMAEELIGNLGYGTLNQTQSIKNSSNAFSPEIANYIWARFTQKRRLKNLMRKKWKNFLIITKLNSQVKSLGHSIINMYSMGACSALGITNQDALSEDLENYPFLNSALQRFTCELYYRFRSFLAPLSVGIITSRHYLLCERNKNGNGEQERTSGTGDNKNGGDEKTAQ